ncbi:hypothetical protein Tco_0936764, partial [Tanacetum coccineum]
MDIRDEISLSKGDHFPNRLHYQFPVKISYEMLIMSGIGTKCGVVKSSIVKSGVVAKCGNNVFGVVAKSLRQRQKLELEEHVLGLFELHNEWTDVELQGNEGFIVAGSMVTSEKE